MSAPAFKLTPVPPPLRYHCVVCGRDVVVYGAGTFESFRVCDSQACLVHYAVTQSTPPALMCACRQRPYPHELKVHEKLRREAFDPTLRGSWPWSLMQADHVEPSTEGGFHA
jgi:hypothetical protein